MCLRVEGLKVTVAHKKKEGGMAGREKLGGKGAEVQGKTFLLLRVPALMERCNRERAGVGGPPGTVVP